MRSYQNKKDVQQKSYYSDRFYIAPQVPRHSIYSDPTFSNDVLSLSKKIIIVESYIELDHLVVIVDATNNLKTIEHLKEICAYDFLVELTAVDYIVTKGGFEVVYEMLSTTKRRRVRVKCFLKQSQAIESVNPLFRMADFSEREMYDMYGIKVNNHPMLKRILMPDDWQGHPLLKTYPLHGDEDAQWYEVDKIFGKESRDIVGPEIRDAAVVDRYDTERFSRLGHEVPFGADISDGEPDTPIQYQEKDGIKIAGRPLVTPFEDIKSVDLEKRR
ncbi:NADH-ubiquinone oxidoreductase chain C [hydrothermal vent metagenome]|uniref:NADH-ubiquinone oxidoreductase chain C n=1 Tax=hydrothermal vent metagenome TaxID=652676 RepID=A0A3B1E730_9ZZZZ